MPAVGLSEIATPGPERKNAVKRQVPGASGAKWTRKLRPDVAPVSAALPSAAKKPGTTYDFTPLRERHRQPIVEERVDLAVFAGLRALEGQRDPMPDLALAAHHDRGRGALGREGRERGHEQERRRERGASGRSQSPGVLQWRDLLESAPILWRFGRRRKERFAARRAASASLSYPCPSSPDRLVVTLRHASARPYDARDRRRAHLLLAARDRLRGGDAAAARDDRAAHLRGRAPHGLAARALRVRAREREPPVRLVVPPLAPLLQLGAVLAALRAPRRGAGARAGGARRRGARASTRRAVESAWESYRRLDGAAEGGHAADPVAAAAPDARTPPTSGARRSSARPRRRRSRRRAT